MTSVHLISWNHVSYLARYNPQLFFKYLLTIDNVINPSKKETPYSFKGQQLENKSLYRFEICNKGRYKLAEIHDDVSENVRFQKLHF